jgi:hypothetical protein
MEDKMYEEFSLIDLPQITYETYIADSSYRLWQGMKTGQKSQLTFNP